MSDIILISKVGLYETIKCTICKNPNQTERGCDGYCQYDKELHAKIVEAVIGIAEQRPHGEWVWKLDEETGESGWNCSVCNEFGDCKSPYCPNCGADMREEGDEK